MTEWTQESLEGNLESHGDRRLCSPSRGREERKASRGATVPTGHRGIRQDGEGADVVGLVFRWPRKQRPLWRETRKGGPHQLRAAGSCRRCWLSTSNAERQPARPEARQPWGRRAPPWALPGALSRCAGCPRGERPRIPGQPCASLRGPGRRTCRLWPCGLLWLLMSTPLL